MDSILLSIKKLLNIHESDNSFDLDIIMLINSAFSTLSQFGVGPTNGFTITDEAATWNDYTSDELVINSVKTYIYLKVRILFDPPTSTAVIDAINKTISELEWRLNVMVETGALKTDSSELEERVNTLENRVNAHDELFKTLVGEE